MSDQVIRTNRSAAKYFEYLSTLFDNQTFHDVVLQLPEGQQVKAHRIVLSASSTYFKSMFESSFAGQEANQQNVQLSSEFSDAVLMEMIQFIYKGECPIKSQPITSELIERICNLHSVALYHFVLDLAKATATFLMKVLVDNSVKDDFRRTCARFFCGCPKTSIEAFKRRISNGCIWKFLDLAKLDEFRDLCLAHEEVGATFRTTFRLHVDKFDGCCMPCKGNKGGLCEQRKQLASELEVMCRAARMNATNYETFACAYLIGPERRSSEVPPAVEEKKTACETG